ncbi:MAG: hypothetical protein HRU24_10340 [Gammaproteobacteria bacterium]|nr:hypothetical protein [Gammaproteobacteria bacterium]
MIDTWLQYLQQGKHLYLNSKEHMEENELETLTFSENFIANDRKRSLKNIKRIIKPLSYKNFLNQYRVYKSRLLCDGVEINISKNNFNNINSLTKILGYQTKNETLELLCQYYAESHHINIKEQ